MPMVSCATMVRPKRCTMLPICCGVVPEANWDTSSSDENRVSPIGGMPEPGGSGVTGMSMRRVPSGAPFPALQPVSEAARGHLDRTLSPGARTNPHPILGPVAAAAGGGGRGLAQTGLEAEAGAIGRESLRVLAKAGIDCIVDRADNGLPRYLRDHRRN